jgi:hypothetical protein
MQTDDMKIRQRDRMLSFSPSAPEAAANLPFCLGRTKTISVHA